MGVTPVLVDHLIFYKKEEIFQVISYLLEQPFSKGIVWINKFKF